MLQNRHYITLRVATVLQTDTLTSEAVEQVTIFLVSFSEEERASEVGKLMQFVTPDHVNVPSAFVTHALVSMKMLKEA